MSHSWQKTLITELSTIKQALEIINSEALRVAVVVDKDKKLLGMVTDGDIRRGLLNNLTLADPVVKIMNTNPIAALEGTSKEQLVDLMDKKQILSIPLLNENGVILGLETLHSAMRKECRQNPVFIMAGGFGTRLKPLTDNCPKPMLKIGGKPILETVINSFVKAGFVNFYISTHYMPEQIENYFGDGSNRGINIEYVYEEQPLGTGGALGLLPNNLSDDLPLIMINGDVLTKVNFSRLLEFHLDNNADATMCVREYDYQIPYGVINGEGNKITSMVEKPVQRFFINAGIYVVSPKIFKSVPRNHKVDMPTLLEQQMEKDSDVLMFPIHEYWLDIGRMDDFNRAQSDILGLGVLQ
ncbi:alcohol dehydrogenase [Vibrio sp. UCD-FRSSP16_10]|uniref:nucleotidyltransferase family protein n=1 Tax=unclassified Vibrio TaxID=2614977 RepID=UPI0007FDD44B|nr:MULTISPECIES: nucleotidyltransferase family protein [unclassified Vibrio]OBT10103.1 alcohol dehydrogenase [Vibrio sp. UCD-FRSSP16_30]OBT18893.1 alcohol dehydrogenase [Vibrio sp. UCD-FRSSP16_10]